MSDRFSMKPDDVMKMLAEFRLPHFADLEGLAQAQRRNLEALSAANRVALEGAQAVARRHMEIVQSSMTEMTEAMRAMTGTESPQDRATRQAELLKSGYERAVSNMKEIADLIQKSNAEALALLNRRFAEAMDEVKQMAAKQGGG
ncbi:phasin family protein [Falsiroseomonas oryzae]|uniref:phasin family protein n=1 Tax=Falsiroseomonas oryzae TaxID=2766473 RepID=UPI0022EB68A1|nr:phasin family protein [Roseomonas sp. MO-31]